jgi:hypothetical protein
LIVINKQPEIGSVLLPAMEQLQKDTGTVVAGGGESHLVQVFDVAEMDSWRAVGAFTAVRFDDTRRDAEIPSSQAEELPELLDFSIDWSPWQGAQVRAATAHESSASCQFVQCGHNRTNCEGPRIPTA